MGWSKEFPKVDGDYYSRIDEYDKQPTPIRIENGAVYEFGAQGSLRREYEVEDYEYLGPITPAQAEQFEALRKAAEDALDFIEAIGRDIHYVYSPEAAANVSHVADNTMTALRNALGKE